MKSNLPQQLPTLLFIATLLLACQPHHAPAQLSDRQLKRIDQAVEKEMAEQKLVGVAIGVIQNGKVEYVHGYGFADLEKETPVTPDTVFNWASNSKPIVAAVALQLMSEGKLDIDADVTSYVPAFPKKKHVVRTRDILCHQSGIPHYRNGTVLGTARQYESEIPFLNPLLAIDRFSQSPLLYTPGSKSTYSSYAYVLLSAVAQQAAQQPIQSLLDDRIIKPLGLESFQLDLPEHQENWATAYGYRLANGPYRITDDAHYWKHGAGGYKSNVKDFASWAAGLIGDEILSPELKTIAWKPQPLTDGSDTTWGLGFVVEGNGRQLKVSHGGSQDETKTRMVIYPNQKHGVVVMSNSNYANPGRISTAIYKALNSKDEE